MPALVNRSRKRLSRLKAGILLRLRPSIADEARRYNDAFFEIVGVDQNEVRATYRELSEALGLRSDDGESVHRLAFTALQKAGFSPNAILELGTLRGCTTIYLAKLFPNAAVYTVELPADDPLFMRWHSDARRRDALIGERFAPYPNIHQVRANTFDLWALNLPRFDLVWLDAGHGFPEVAWDHAYCFAHLNEGGWLLSDDIRVPGEPCPLNVAKKPASKAPIEVIEYIRARKPWKNGLLLKREDPVQYLILRDHIAWFHKVSS